MNKLKFFSESLKNLKTIGTITRSSQYLCEKMVSFVDFENSKVIVELGAGDGVITEHILAGMRPDAVLLTFEVNKKFIKTIKEKIKDDRMILIPDSAEKLPEYLKKYGLDSADNIVSALPFVNIPDNIGTSIKVKSRDVLKKGGKFIQVHYSLLEKSSYENIFGNVDVSFEPRNIPPAFVLVSEKK
jgi:phospholipid N-methyltransferase